MTSLSNPQQPAHIAWRKSADGRLVWVSDTYTQLLGISEAVGKTPAEISPELRENAWAIDRGCLKSGHAVRLNETRAGVWVTWQHFSPCDAAPALTGGAAVFISAPTSE